jgi:hypothetical protein
MQIRTNKEAKKMNITIEEERVIEKLRRLRESEGVRFDIAGAFEKDIQNIQEFANCNIPSFSKEFFLKQVEIQNGNQASVKKAMTNIINSIWH